MTRAGIGATGARDQANGGHPHALILRGDDGPILISTCLHSATIMAGMGNQFPEFVRAERTHINADITDPAGGGR
jgi:hypothetical protein